MTLLCELCVSVLSALTIIAATFNAEAAEMQSFAEMNWITFGAKPPIDHEQHASEHWILRGLLMVAATVVSAKEWRGIVPLKSTRQDVERLFGVPKKFSEGLAYYNLSNEIVVFHFKVGTCDGDRFGFTWNVPPDTVVGIGVIPKGVHRGVT